MGGAGLRGLYSSGGLPRGHSRVGARLLPLAGFARWKTLAALTFPVRVPAAKLSAKGRPTSRRVHAGTRVSLVFTPAIVLSSMVRARVRLRACLGPLGLVSL